MTSALKQGPETTPEVRHHRQFIDGQWVDAVDGSTFQRTSPATGEVIAHYANGGEEDARRAIAAARRVFDQTDWPTSRASERAAILFRAADILRSRAEEVAVSIASELGRPIVRARTEALSTAALFEYYAGKALDLRGDAITAQTPGAIGLIVQEPVGVVAMITPWNFPLSLLGWKVGPAIAAGCTIVSKPSHYTPWAALILAEVLTEAGLPAGVFNIVTSNTDNGALVGGYLAQSELVDKVAFTGSTASGKSVMRAAANNVKKVSLELGGKSPNIVFPDAPIERAVSNAFTGIFNNSGQVCSAASRLFVSRKIHDNFVEQLVDLAEGMQVGDPMDPATQMGPVVNENQMTRVLGYLEQGKQEANLLVGGMRLGEGDYARGLYIAPTIFDEVENTDTIAREEIFGPVLSVLSFDDVDDIIRMANDTIYGLSAAVWTQDINTAFKVARGLRSGQVFVNAYGGAGLSNMPFGGYKQSGLGRELGPNAIDEYMETKAIHIKLG